MGWAPNLPSSMRQRGRLVEDLTVVIIRSKQLWDIRDTAPFVRPRVSQTIMPMISFALHLNSGQKSTDAVNNYVLWMWVCIVHVYGLADLAVLWHHGTCV